MRLLLDLQCVQSTSARRGIGRYALSLTRSLVEQRGEHQVEVLLNGGDDVDRLLRARAVLETFLDPRAIHVFDAPWPWRFRVDDRRRRLAELARAAAVRSLRPDALLVGSVFEGDGETVLSVDGTPDSPPTAAILYDLIPAAEPETYLLGPGADVYWRRFDDLRRTDRLLAISRHSGDQAAALLGTGCPPVTPVWGGPFPSDGLAAYGPADDENDGPDLPASFVLAVGGDHPRKNLDRLVEAWAATPAQVRETTALVVACRLAPGTVRRLRKAARRRGLPDDAVLLLGEVAESTLDELYRRALGFVFPSTEEGLGLPPLEAMARGCPTIMARGSSLSELADDETAYFDGTSTRDMARALTALVTSPELRRRLQQVAARSSERFTWQHSAELAWRGLEEMVGQQRWSVSSAAACSAPPVARLSELDPALLPARPVAVVLDSPPEQVPPSAAGDEDGLVVHSPLPAGVRTSLAAATAVVAQPAAAAQLLRAGLLHLPLLSDEQELEQLGQHDLYAELAALLAGAEPSAEELAAFAEATQRPPRWMLQRPRPVVLVLREDLDSSGAEELATAADGCGLDLVLGNAAGAGLAVSADAVLVQAELHDDLAEDLLLARCYGARVVPVAAGGWPSALQELARAGGSTGWPWPAGA